MPGFWFLNEIKVALERGKLLFPLRDHRLAMGLQNQLDRDPLQLTLFLLLPHLLLPLLLLPSMLMGLKQGRLDLLLSLGMHPPGPTLLSLL